jgi:hypothetical protein
MITQNVVLLVAFCVVVSASIDAQMQTNRSLMLGYSQNRWPISGRFFQSPFQKKSYHQRLFNYF